MANTENVVMTLSEFCYKFGFTSKPRYSKAKGKNSILFCEETIVLEKGKKVKRNKVKKVKDPETGAQSRIYYSAPKLVGEDGLWEEGTFFNKDGETYTAPVRCLSKKMATVDGVDILQEWRSQINKFLKEELPNGEWQVMRCTHDPEDVSQWDMALEWDEERVAAYCAAHPYFIAFWQKPEYCEDYAEEIDVELLDDLSEVI